MMRTLYQFWFALLPLFFGVFEQTVDIAGHHYQNLIWGTVDGLGLFAVDETVGLSIAPSFGKFFGFVIWPLLVSAFLFWFSGTLWRKNCYSRRWLYALMLLLTGLCVIDVYWAGGRAFHRLPLYFDYMFDFT